MYSELTPMTSEQYREIYKKLPKKDLIEMLIEANRVLQLMTPVIMPPVYPTYPTWGAPEITCNSSEK